MPWHRGPSEVCEGKATTTRGEDRVVPENEVVTASVIQGKWSSVRRGKELFVSCTALCPELDSLGVPSSLSGQEMLTGGPEARPTSAGMGHSS